MLEPFSGPAAIYGVQFRQGFDWKVDEINKAGGFKVGVDTYMIKPVYGDDKGVGSEGAKEAARFVYDEHIHYVHCLNWAAPEPIFIEGKVFLASCATNNFPSPDKPYRIMTALASESWYSTFWEMGYKFHPEIKKIAEVVPTGAAFEYWKDILNRIHAKHGAEVVMFAEYAGGTVDYYPVLTAVVAKNPDAVAISTGAKGDNDLIIKQIRELGYKGPLFGPSYGDPASAIAIAGAQAVEGFASNDPDYNSPLFPESTRQLYAEFQRRYPGQAFAVTTYIGYTGTELFVAAMQAAGSIDPDEVMKVLDDPNFTYTAFGQSGRKLGGYETYGMRRVAPIDVAYSVVENGKKVMKDVIAGSTP